MMSLLCHAGTVTRNILKMAVPSRFYKFLIEVKHIQKSADSSVCSPVGLHKWTPNPCSLQPPPTHGHPLPISDTGIESLVLKLYKLSIWLCPGSVIL